MTEQHRHKGRFERKSKTEWRRNVSITAKRRKKDTEESQCAVNGARLMDLPTIAKDLWCNECNNALSFRNIVGESCSGLASTFKLKCEQCLYVHLVRTSNFRNHDNYDNRKRQFSINVKAATAIIDGEMGVSQLKSVLSEFNMPSTSKNLMRRHERILEKALHELADESCERAIQEEKEATMQKIALSSNKAVSIEEPVKITASVDGSWSKRGNGRNYNSNSGIF